MALSKTETCPLDMDIVRQNAIHVETIMKEQRSHKVYTKFSINPNKKLHIMTDKPMSRKTQEFEEDSSFIEAIHAARLVPTKKYAYPQTASQEIGWISTPLMVSDRSDRRLNFHRQNSEITKYMEEAWRITEQTQNLS